MTEQGGTLKCKIIIVGDYGVGKTSLMNRFCKNNYNAHSIATVGVNFEPKCVQVLDKTVKLEIWDTAGTEKFYALSKLYLRDSIGAVFVYDVTRQVTLYNLKKWIDAVDEAASSNVVKVLVGHKCDDVNHKELTTEEGKLVADYFGMFFFEASSKEDIDVSPIFNVLASKIVVLHKIGAIKLETGNISISNENYRPENNSRCCSYIF